MKRIHFTLKGGNHAGVTLWDETTAPVWIKTEYCALFWCESHNQIRRRLAILSRMGQFADTTSYAVVRHTDRAGMPPYAVWVRTNYAGVAGFQAGIVHAYEKLCPLRKSRHTTR